ncbi:MAG: SDR family oxidoreductase [Hyphomicrobiales bacterium]|nr:SDR family oxidoreductase [Hyphomicrobiales bacterium]
MSLFDLSGRVVIVTGGNGGIGLGMAQGMAAAGAAVSIWGRNEAKNAEALKTLANGKCEARVCDVSDPNSIERAFQETVAKYGRVDGCFANAGIGGGGRRSFVDRPQSEWREMLATNLDGAVLTMQHAARHMKERAEKGDAFGRLVATSSLASISGTARNEHYAATKGALNSIIRALAVELARYGVTAHCVLPGWIKSEMTGGLFGNEKFVANVMPRIPMRRFGEPSDFAAIAVYIMSTGSSYHTAEMFLIDGAYSIF